MPRYVNTVYTFVLPNNTSDLPHELWVVMVLQTLDTFIKRTIRKKAMTPVNITPHDLARYAYSYCKDPEEFDGQLSLAKDHIFAALMEIVADDALQSLTLYNPHQTAERLVTAYRIIEGRNYNVTWVKLYVRA